MLLGLIFSGLLRANCRNSTYVHIVLVLWAWVLSWAFSQQFHLLWTKSWGPKFPEGYTGKAHLEAFRKSDWNRILVFFKAMMVDGELKEF